MIAETSLPIDVIPGTKPPIFRWKQTVDTPVGRRTVEQEGRVPPSMEAAVMQVIALAEAAADIDGQRAKLQAFKDWVHDYLDAQGVPTNFPDGPHTKEGCRVGDRLDWLVEQLRVAQKQVAELEMVAEVPETSPQPQAVRNKKGRAP
jgi:hypothetical protein